VIEAKTKAYPNKVFVGQIAFVDSRIDPVTRSIGARALLDNTDKLLKPGLLMQVELQKNPRKALLIPEEALTANGPDNFVFIVTESNGEISAQRHKVVLGTRQYGEVEIISGLEQGQQIVTHGNLRVRPGAPLKITAIENNNETLDQLLNNGVETKNTDDKNIDHIKADK
jgi:membrane fusion protein (multidrug efflux system)